MTIRGRITRTQSGFFWVETPEGTYVSQLRGRLRHGRKLGDVAAVGDWAQITPVDSERAMIEEVEPRQRLIARKAPSPHGEYQQVIIANPDQAVFIFACTRPDPRLGMLDRFLVTAEEQGILSFIVANKVDLVGLEKAQEIFGHYPALGYPVIYTSVKQNLGIGDLRSRLAGKVSLFAGPSGVGKSSLLNAVQPGLGLAVREISQATSKGRHTTVVRQMFPLEEGGYVADTPGLKALALWDITPEEVDGYFPEIRDLVAECQFNDCTHTHEPGCAVLAALNEGIIHPQRYTSYIHIRQGEEVE